MLLARILRNPLRLELLSGETRSANTHEQSTRIRGKRLVGFVEHFSPLERQQRRSLGGTFKHVAAIIRDLSQGQANAFWKWLVAQELFPVSWSSLATRT